jgi:hypothetical protein
LKRLSTFHDDDAEREIEKKNRSRKFFALMMMIKRRSKRVKM